MHALVETQLAMDNPTAMLTALERLVAQGLHRHDATHVLGVVLAKHIEPVLPGAGVFDVAGFARALDAMNLKDCVRRGEPHTRGLSTISCART